MLSYWDKNSFLSYDYIVIGAGIVGFSTAYHLKTQKPAASVAILEAGILPSGASTRNAGFACFGSLTELAEDIDTLGAEKTLMLVEKRYKGLQLLREILGDDGIDYQELGGFELIKKADHEAMNKISELNQLLYPLFEKDVFSEQSHLIEHFQFSKDAVSAIIKNQFEGQIDTGKMMKSWWDLCASLGITVHTGCEVQQLNRKGRGLELLCIDHKGQEHHFQAQKVAICTNAFTKKLLPKVKLRPGRGMILLTKPMRDLKFEGTFHIERGYFYFRNIHNRILIGGGRNLAKKEEEVFEFGINEKIEQSLHHYLQKVILPNQQYEIDQSWSGIMAFGDDRYPIVEKFEENITIGVKMGGMGVAVGTEIGREVSNLLVD